METQYPGLTYLCRAYLHQDYTDSGGTLDDAVRDFTENTPEPTLLATSHDIDRLTDSSMTETEVLRVLKAVGLKVNVRSYGWSLRPWLAWVKEGIGRN
jgi:hypothetical protein